MRVSILSSSHLLSRSSTSASVTFLGNLFGNLTPFSPVTKRGTRDPVNTSPFHAFSLHLPFFSTSFILPPASLASSNLSIWLSVDFPSDWFLESCFPFFFSSLQTLSLLLLCAFFSLNILTSKNFPLTSPTKKTWDRRASTLCFRAFLVHSAIDYVTRVIFNLPIFNRNFTKFIITGIRINKVFYVTFE